MHAKCSGILNAAQYWRSSDWTCDPCSTPPQIPSPAPTSTPFSDNTSDDSTFNVLQLSANGIGNKLTELGVVIKRNKTNSGGETGVKNHISYSPNGHHKQSRYLIPHMEELSIKAELGNTALIICNGYRLDVEGALSKRSLPIVKEMRRSFVQFY